MKLHNLKAHRNLIIILVIIKIVLIVWFTNVKENLYTNNSEEESMMNVMIYLQDKEVALYSDCGVTYPKEITIAKTKAVANASLTYLFENELSRYGNYESVVIKDGVAQITLLNENDPNGYKIAGLSSCESRHLFTVLSDTLTQYETINSVELYSPSGKIEF